MKSRDVNMLVASLAFISAAVLAGCELQWDTQSSVAIAGRCYTARSLQDGPSGNGRLDIIEHDTCGDYDQMRTLVRLYALSIDAELFELRNHVLVAYTYWDQSNPNSHVFIVNPASAKDEFVLDGEADWQHFRLIDDSFYDQVGYELFELVDHSGILLLRCRWKAPQPKRWNESDIFFMNMESMRLDGRLGSSITAVLKWENVARPDTITLSLPEVSDSYISFTMDSEHLAQ